MLEQLQVSSELVLGHYSWFPFMVTHHTLYCGSCDGSLLPGFCWSSLLLLCGLCFEDFSLGQQEIPQQRESDTKVQWVITRQKTLTPRLVISQSRMLRDGQSWVLTHSPVPSSNRYLLSTCLGGRTGDKGQVTYVPQIAHSVAPRETWSWLQYMCACKQVELLGSNKIKSLCWFCLLYYFCPFKPALWG